MRAFTHNINVRNVNEALECALRYLPYGAQAADSRAGRVVVSDTPVITCYANPMERVLFSPLRDCNPFFHFMEALWMLAGRDDVAFPSMFNSTFGQFSDNGETFWGAYGARWRKWFGYDQLELIIQELQNNPDTRRCVLSMWSPCYVRDFTDDRAVQPDIMQALAGGKDVPCNTNVFFRVIGTKERGPQLDIMVNCRSNDLFWGAYGANAVHFSVLQEYVASSVGLAVGRYWQNSFNFHAYTDKFPEEEWKAYADDARAHNLYAQDKVAPFAMMAVPREQWDAELLAFMQWAESDFSAPPPSFGDHFFISVAVPMRLAYKAFKEKDYPTALMRSEEIAATDWRAACTAWLQRRREKHERRI